VVTGLSSSSLFPSDGRAPPTNPPTTTTTLSILESDRERGNHRIIMIITIDEISAAGLEKVDFLDLLYSFPFRFLLHVQFKDQ
jgi:hypothetical protein